MIYTIENSAPGCKVVNALDGDSIGAVRWIDPDSLTFATIITNSKGFDVTIDRQYFAVNVLDAHSMEFRMDEIGRPEKITIRPVV